MLVAWLFLRRRLPKSDQLTVCEYWVYLPEPRMPKLEAIMDRMISSNPHNRPGRPCIGAREGMLFTDIRLHMAIARRTKNPQIFRPDLFDSAVEPSRETLAGLAQAHAIAKLQYVSEEPLSDRRHLQFMTHLADAIAQLGGGLVVFDLGLDRLETRDEFHKRLAEHPNQERVDHHLRVVAIPHSEGGWEVGSRGLQKIGVPEIRTEPVPDDERTVVVGLVEELAGRLWAEGLSGPGLPDLELQGQKFRISELKRTRTRLDIRIARVVSP